jgi:CubicO group peptidase (beta-lactamase class C family)
MQDSLTLRLSLALVCGVCSSTAAQISAYHNVSSATHQSNFNSLSKAGYRPISLSVYGTASSLRYAAVWAKRAGPGYVGFQGMTASQFQAFFDLYRPQGFVPHLLTATGSGSNTRFAGIFEYVGASSWTRYGLTESQMNDEVGAARKSGYILHTADVYGTSSAPRYVAHFRKRLDNTPWNDSIASASTFPAYFNAYVEGHSRPVHIAINGTSRVLSIWHGTDCGGFYCYNNLTSSAYQFVFNSLGSTGYYPMCVQGTGSGSSIRLAAIFVKRETPLPLVFRATGTAVPELAGFDTYVRKLMEDGDVPAASLAVVRDGRLVLARGYTNAASSYPLTQPTSMFRIASISKSVTGISIQQQVERRSPTQINDLSLMMDFMPKITPKDSRTNQVRIKNLLTHTGGWDIGVLNFDPSFYDAQIASAQSVSLPISLMDSFRYMTTKQNLQFNTGTSSKYSNYGFRLLGLTLESLHPGESYEKIVKRNVFQALGCSRPQLGRSLKANRAAGEVTYHPTIPAISKSVMSASRPWVAQQYGGWNQRNLAAEGGWVMAAPDLGKVLGSFDLGDQNPLMSAASRDKMWESAYPSSSFSRVARGWWRRSVYSKGKSLMLMSHNGGLPGTSTLGVHRSDGTSFVLFLNKNIGLWDSPHGTGLSKIADSVASWPSHDLFPSVGIPSFRRYTKGTSTSYGLSCAGYFRTPLHTLSGTPEIQNSVSFRLAGAPVLANTMFYIGFSKTTIDLGFIGAPGCKIYTDMAIGIPALADPNGIVSLASWIPNDTSLIGARPLTQFAVLDPRANQLGMTWTNGLETTIGGWK